ncbi:MAG: hypothetical protein IJL47_09690 [Lachnospiraceae bacterium]|nr:hypothetical protein [Lachnospiraceae bacterium]
MYRYYVSDEDYLNMVRVMLVNQRGPKKTAVLKLLLKTVLQMGAAAFLILFYPDAPSWMKWTIGIFSLLWAALAVFQYSFLDFRAKLLLKQSKTTAPDYWKEHRLDVTENALRLSYGETKLELPFREVTALQETETLQLIFRNKDVFEAVPRTAVSDEDWGKIREKILGRQREERSEALDKLCASVLEGASFKAHLDLTQDELAEKIMQMTRASFRYGPGWSGRTVFTFAFPLVLAVYSAIGGAWATFALCMAAFILFNMRVFLVFMPAYRAIIREKLMPPAEDGYLLAVKDKTAYLLGEGKAFNYDLAAMKKQVGTDDGLYVYFDKQAMLFVPQKAADGFLRASGLKKSLKARAEAGLALSEADHDDPTENE